MKFFRRLRLNCLNLFNKFLSSFGWRLERNLPDYITYPYSSYEEYRETQIKWNKIKIDRVWADSQVLDLVVTRIRQNLGSQEIFGLCHGSRNGFEQNYLLSHLKGQILGTDISETAELFPYSVVHDFHDVNPAWESKADFIYSNSLDQSWKPELALQVWVNQLKIGGLLYIEMSEGHSPRHASKMDPFGVKPEYFAYLLSQWIGHAVSIEVLHSKKTKWNMPIWLYEVKRIT